MKMPILHQTVIVVLGLTGSFVLFASPAAGLTAEAEKAMDAYVRAHLADEFTTKDVIRLLELKVDSDLLIKEIAYRVSKNVDLTFSASDAELDQLKRAGASNDLIEALRSPISAVRFVREHSSAVGAANLAASSAASPSSESLPSATVSATQSATPSPAPERSLVSLSAGGMIVNKAQEYNEKWATIWLLDERPTYGWCTPQGTTTNQVIVIALPELTLLKSVTFDTASIDGSDGRGAKDVLVEVSKENENGGFEKIAEVSLQDQADNQTFPASAEIPGRWVRLTVKNNHGSRDFTELMDFRATGTQLTHTVPSNISGTYSTNYRRFHIRQEGTSVTGCYEYKEGLLEGGIDGRVTSFTWKQTNGRGPATIVLTSDGKYMCGIWWFEGKESDRGLWYGTKESSQVGSCSHWTGGIENQLTQDLETVGRARVYGINFDTDSDRIKDESKPTLDKIVAMLRSKADWKMTIEGHTDSTSTLQHNQGLSEQRAASVKNYLQTAGIDSSRLTTIGYGQTKPVADNDSPIGRAQNRRVELTKQ